MEYEKIKQLINDMENSKLNVLDIEFPEGIKIRTEKRENPIIKEVDINHDIGKKHEIGEEMNKSKKEEIEGNIVRAPMVGTFYMKSSPTSHPFVEVGSEVKKGSILCIIEAMKLMNEIESEYDGKVAEIYVKDGDPVDYGKPLFRII